MVCSFDEVWAAMIINSIINSIHTTCHHSPTVELREAGPREAKGFAHSHGRWAWHDPSSRMPSGHGSPATAQRRPKNSTSISALSKSLWEQGTESPREGRAAALEMGKGGRREKERGRKPWEGRAAALEMRKGG